MDKNLNAFITFIVMLDDLWPAVSWTHKCRNWDREELQVGRADN